MENEDDNEEQINDNHMNEEIYDDIYSNPENIDLSSAKTNTEKYEILLFDELIVIRKKIGELTAYSSLSE